MLRLMLSLSFVQIILNVVLSVHVPCVSQLGFYCSVCSVGWSGCLPGKCVLLSTSQSVRKAMKFWDVFGSCGFWKVQLDVRDLGGHLNFTLRARA